MRSWLFISVMIFALILLSSLVSAQITITSSDATAINAVGHVITNHFDSTTTSVDIGSPGATSWNFSALNSHTSNTFTSVVPSSTPFYSTFFPTSNVVFEYTANFQGVIGNCWSYSKQNATNYEQQGVVVQSALGTDTMLLKTVYSPAQLDLTLPFTYNDQWGGSFTMTNTTYFNGIPFTNVTTNHTETVVVDAYGQLTFPGGSVVDALRIKRDDRYTTSLPPFYERTISYSFITKSGSAVHVVAIDTTSPNSGSIQVEGVAWSNSNTVDVENENIIPTIFSLEQNYPNPFNPATKIIWQSPVSSWQTIKVFNSLGQEVETIVNEYLEAGVHSKLYIVNSTLPSGVYFYSLQVNSFRETKKMILLR